MRSVTNIQKITKAMKMVAASKMRVAQVSTEKARGLIVPLVKSLGDLPGKAKIGPACFCINKILEPLPMQVWAS